ncbi:group II intron reverse transcriptase/maturase [Paenibacillus sp. MMO-177]|uniref:group II intron reverse transcriptase/maturase n=1 Tax=Paenibacillus sp. MMO-177 TaxID=3081289 RepID=UPI00301A0016
MFEAIERITYLSKLAGKNKDLRFKDLYKIIERREFLEFAYQEIRSNKGSMTSGVDSMNRNDLEETEENKWDEIFNLLTMKLKDKSYSPLPVRRVSIPKKGKGKRHLGIPALRDRIVQSAIKLILEAIFEPTFSKTSHGFRPKHSCQTAINDIVTRKYDWVIEGDIKGCFDHIKHGKLLDILRKRIADEDLIQLINKFLKSGYQIGYGTDGKTPYFQTPEGTPQGGIISPILANVYLSEFDKFMEKKIHTMDQSIKRPGAEYRFLTNKVTRLKKALKEGKSQFRISLERGNQKTILLENREAMVNALRQFKKERAKTPSIDTENYFSNTSLGYVRYADDFVILMGNYHKEDAKVLKSQISEWFFINLGLTLSAEKTAITHSTKGFNFLGYHILQIPSDKGIGYLPFAKVYVKREAIDNISVKLETYAKLHTNYPAVDVIVGLNRIITGWSNYYRVSNNWHSVASSLDNKLFWLMMHWLARKYKSSIPAMYRNHVKNNKIVIISGDKRYVLKKFSDFKFMVLSDFASKVRKGQSNVDLLFPISKEYQRTVGKALSGHSLEFRDELSSKSGEICAKCGETSKQLVVHHTRMVKRSTRRNGIAVMQASRDLPKILICEHCHRNVHPNTKMIRG